MPNWVWLVVLGAFSPGSHSQTHPTQPTAPSFERSEAQGTSRPPAGAGGGRPAGRPRPFRDKTRVVPGESREKDHGVRVVGRLRGEGWVCAPSGRVRGFG